jgi:hypothetical protein
VSEHCVHAPIAIEVVQGEEAGLLRNGHAGRGRARECPRPVPVADDEIARPGCRLLAARDDGVRPSVSVHIPERHRIPGLTRLERRDGAAPEPPAPVAQQGGKPVRACSR